MRRKGMRGGVAARALVAALAIGLTVMGCASGGRGTGGEGYVAPRPALDAFLAAAKARDLEAMGAVWGGERGSAAAYMPREEREKRLLIMQCHLQHDSARILAEYPADGGRRGFRVELVFRGVTRATTMQAALGPNRRWYLESADIEKTAEFCRLGGVGKG